MVQMKKPKRHVKSQGSKRNLNLPAYLKDPQYQAAQVRNLTLFKKFFDRPKTKPTLFDLGVDK